MAKNSDYLFMGSIIFAIVMIAVFFSRMNMIRDEQLKPNPVKDITFSENNNVALILINRELRTNESVTIIANMIEYLLSQGYEYEGSFQTDIGSGEAHFIEYLIFRRGGIARIEE